MYKVQGLGFRTQGFLGFRVSRFLRFEEDVLGGPPRPVIVTIRDHGDYIRVLLYSYYTTITGWGSPPMGCSTGTDGGEGFGLKVFRRLTGLGFRV